jgi:hypothetical protein
MLLADAAGTSALRLDQFLESLTTQVQGHPRAALDDPGRDVADGEILVQLHERRPQAHGRHRRHRREAMREGRKVKGQQGMSLRRWKHLQGRLGNQAKDPFCADEELGEVGTGRRLRHRPCAQQLAISQHYFETEHLFPH